MFRRTRIDERRTWLIIRVLGLCAWLGSGVSSRAAAGPAVTAISSRGNPNGITINWSKPVSATGTNGGNYTVNFGVTVTSARYGSSNSVVILTTSTLSEGTNYSVTISNVQDTAVPPDTIS